MAHPDISNCEFIEAIKQYLKNYLQDPQRTCFPCLVRSAHGCYPQTLKHVADTVGIVFEDCAWHQNKSGWDVPLASEFFPHVLDGDWRYSRPGVAKLLDAAFRQVGGRASFLHVGSPSTYIEALRAFPNRGKHWLYDRNSLKHNELSGNLSISEGKRWLYDRNYLYHESRRIENVEAGDCDAAIVDPPWYQEVTISFMAIARSVLRDNAPVFLAQPAEFARPGVATERADIVSHIEALGYDFIERRPDFVRYETPHFEWVTLRSQMTGQRIPADWRVGDLLVFRKKSQVSENTEHYANNSEKNEWIERTLGPMRLKIRDVHDGKVKTFAPVTTTGMAENVSRRDPERNEVGIWTSGNRIFGCLNTQKALNMVEEMRQLMIRAELNHKALVAVYLKYHKGEDIVAEKFASTMEGDVMEHIQHAFQ